MIEQWRWEYNAKRPHTSLEYRTPAEVDTESRATLTQKSTPNEIAAHRGSCQAAAERSTIEVHLITTETCHNRWSEEWSTGSSTYHRLAS